MGGCLDDNPQLLVGEHIFVGSKAHWEVIGDGAPQFEKGTPTDVILDQSS